MFFPIFFPDIYIYTNRENDDWRNEDVGFCYVDVPTLHLP